MEGGLPAIHGVRIETPSRYAIAAPVTGWRTTAGAVKIQSARTVRSAATRIARTSPLRSVIHLKYAMPIPVPNKIVPPTTCSHFRIRYPVMRAIP